MIKANELRIGNYVFDISSNRINEIDRITADHFVCIATGRDLECEPIPLTEEILLNIGFKKSKYEHVADKDFDCDMFVINALPNCEYFCLKDGKLFSNGDLSKSIDYVHQLQNLYFALTGKELKVNL